MYNNEHTNNSQRQEQPTRSQSYPQYHGQSNNVHLSQRALQMQQQQQQLQQQQQIRNDNRQAHELASMKKDAAETKYFWNLVAKANQKLQQQNEDPSLKNENSMRSSDPELSERHRLNKQREEMMLFGHKPKEIKTIPGSENEGSTLDDGEEVGGETDSNIPVENAPEMEQESEVQEPVIVERTGEGQEKIPILENFKELKNIEKYVIPPFVINNIDLMRYEVPTPIQKHSIPLGIAGFDLMCCAQTVSELKIQNEKSSIFIKAHK